MGHHAKPSRMLHSKITKSNDLPPGFENNHHVNMKEKSYRIPRIKWKCPPKFVLSSNWQIAAGEESEEVTVQKLREMRVLEAFYPHTSAIPTCPAVSSGIEDDGHDDRLTPVIRIIPVEEEEEASEAPSRNTIPIRLLPPASPQAQLATKEASETISEAKEKTASGMSHGLGLNLITAAALAATLESNEIDTQLLIKIFSDPKMVEKLIKEYGGAANAGANVTTTATSKVSDPVTGKKQATKPIPPVSVPTIVLKPAAAQPIPLTSSKPAMVQPPNGKVGHFTNGMQPILLGPILPDTIPSVSAPTIVLKPAAAQPVPLTSSKPDMIQPPTAKVGHFTYGMQPILPGNGNGNGTERPIVGNENPHKAQKQVNVVPSLMPGRVPDPSLETVRGGSGCCPVKDVNYYKKLIRQHGRESQESNIPFQDPKNQYHNQKLNTGEFRTKKQKPCAYFNSSRGCRNGANCLFKHEMITQKRGGSVEMEPQNTKRMRIGGEIANST